MHDSTRKKIGDEATSYPEIIRVNPDRPLNTSKPKPEVENPYKISTTKVKFKPVSTLDFRG
jgi:hypothetical protein